MKLVHAPLRVAANRPATGRGGFTLLELLAATIIGGMILAGLYTVMHMTVTQTQASREQVDAEDVSRAVFNKIALDLANVLGPAPPKSGGTPANAAVVSTTDSSDTTATTTSTGGDNDADDMVTTTTTTSGSMTSTSDSSTPAASPNYPFQVGVIGTGTQLTVFASRVPDVLGTPGGLSKPTDSNTQFSSDLVRIDYWKGAGGLCRQERPWVTADQTGNNFNFAVSNEAGNVIADEVTDVLFEYFDGTEWVETWEGGGGTIPFPPVAIRATLTFTRPNPRGGEPISKTTSRMIPVRTAPGTSTPVLTDPLPESTATESDTGASSTPSTGTTGSTGSTGSTGISAASGGSGK